MADCYAIADGRTVVLHVDAEPLEVQGTKQKLFDVCRQIVEGVLKLVHAWCIAVAKADVIRSDEMEFVLELRDQITKHMRGTWKAVQENNCRRTLRACLAIEHLETADGRVLVRWHVLSLQVTGSEPLSAAVRRGYVTPAKLSTEVS